MAQITRQLGRISQSCRNLSWQKAQNIFNEALCTLASDFPPSRALNKILDQKEVIGFTGGDEHNNFRATSEASRIFKITHSNSFGCAVRFDPHGTELTGRNFIACGNDAPYFYLHRWELLNSIGEYQTRLECIPALFDAIASKPSNEAHQWLTKKLT